jgi:hypothetical protein
MGSRPQAVGNAICAAYTTWGRSQSRGRYFNAYVPYQTDPTAPIGRWKEAWEAAKKRAGVQCRFHDLRHTGCTRMLEAGVPFPVLASLMGWSAATTARMAKRYGHIGQTALRSAVEAISAAGSTQKEGHEKPAGSFENPFEVNGEPLGKAPN